MARRPYIYTPLPRRSDTGSNTGLPNLKKPIRLLNLLPGAPSDRLIGELIVHQLKVLEEPVEDPRRQDNPVPTDPRSPTAIDPGQKQEDDQQYEALSYAWGDPDAKECINILDDKRACRTLQVTSNLELALRHLRHDGETRCLWVDAICINQNDKSEKSEQVPIMGQIYSRASNLCIWLGEENSTSRLAFEHINLVLNLQNFEQTVHEKYADAWAALSDLMKREWFSRRWVVQEIAYAQKASVHCGKQQIDWTELADAVALFGSRADEIANLFRGHRKYNHRNDYLGDVQALGANRLVTTIGMLFRKADDGKRIAKLLTLESLVSRLPAFKASVPHDIIYAVLSLARDTITSASQPAPHEPQLAEPNADPEHELNINGVGAVGSSNDPDSLSPMPTHADGQPHGREAVFGTNSRRPSFHGSFRPPVPFLQHPSPDSAAYSLQHPFLKALPDDISDAIDYLIKLGWSEKEVKEAFDRVKSQEAIFQKGTATGSPESFWDEPTRNALSSSKGRSAVAFRLLLMQHRNEKVLQNLQDKMTAATGTVKLFVDTLQNRVNLKTFHVHYMDKEFYAVCKEFIKFVIRSSESLDMLFRPWAPVKEDLPMEDLSKEDTDLPSWICRLDKSPFRPRPDGNFGRVNADLLVGLPDSGSPTYSASALTKPNKAEFSPQGRSLYVDGMVLDDIGELTVPAVEGNVPNEWLKLGEWHKIKEEPPDSFWRTLVGDRDHNGHNPPWYYRRACLYAFAQRVTGGALNTDRLMSSESSKIVTDYLKRVQAVVFNRRLIRTRDGRRLGLVPDTAREGDKVCILRGCSVPVILRETDDDGASVTLNLVPSRDPAPKNFEQSATSNGAIREPVSPVHEKIPEPKVDKHFKCKVIGECYIHGVMDGEAFRIRDRQKLPAAKFELI
ncbi:hypothetical protein H2200_004618 [Cladophialophora chaetospira]|uniref:Heterokaryon incompatibility domain-containing protein n=1 Tax=Cladophialophora chaetospira TaxID=386627 RepID=A0AA39CKM3_9EURO|nr:hypothetical protein H2200_004618 [Cladophialophora chaetospira]